jgi:thiol-disulfide isomerase/thioredoxin
MITDAQTDSTTLVSTGSLSPSFECTTNCGKEINISAMRGKIIMINFFAIWCPPCKLELPVLQKYIWERYRDYDDFMLLIIGREHNNYDIDDFVTEKRYKMTFVADPNRKIYNLFATQYIPRNVVIDKDGKVIFQNRSYSAKELKIIEDLLEEKLKKN